MLGLRVMRGPDWRDGDTDGGEGYVGTLIQLLGNHTVRVLWDMGQESTCSAGADGKLELRVFDTAQSGECLLWSRRDQKQNSISFHPASFVVVSDDCPTDK